MDKNQIISELKRSHADFIQKIIGLSDIDFTRKPGEKWTSGQQLDHIYKSVKPTDMAFGLPMFVLKMKFGLANRSSKTYDDLVEKYRKALKNAKNFEMPKNFKPDELSLKAKSKTLKKLESLIEKLCSRLARYTEEDLDDYILPHPLMGKLTLREMLYFTIYHVGHHERQILENLQNEH